MYRLNILFLTIIQFVLLIDGSKQSNVKQAKVAAKAIGSTIKSPLLKQVGATLKIPIIKTFGNTIKNSLSMFSRNKNSIKNLACGLQEKYLKTRHNFGSKTVKYLGEEGIKKFKHMAPQSVTRGNQLFATGSKNNIWMGGKELGSVVKRSAEQMRRKKLGSLINMISKGKPQLPFLVGGGLMRLSQANLMAGYQEGEPIDNSSDWNMSPHNPHGNKGMFGGYSDDSLDEGIASDKKKWAQKKEMENNLESKQKVEIDNEPAVLVKDVVKGHLVMEHGKAYDGEYILLTEQPHGFGKLTYPNGGYYEGNFVKNKPHGKGKFIYSDEEEYEGDFVGGRFDGVGKHTSQDGYTYIGDFSENEYEGIGKLYTPEGEVHEGEFKKDRLHGEGRLTYKNGEHYIGDFKNGKFAGHGTFTYKDGDVYRGEYSAGKKSGHGEYLWTDGDYYKGQWRSDKYNGEGEYFQIAKNQKMKGVWKNGKKVRSLPY